MEVHRFKSWVQDPRRLHALEIRRVIERETRNYFDEAGFIETRTPLLVPSPGMEAHLNPVEVYSSDPGKRAFLPTSPEFAMKKLLAGGLEKIYQLAPSFRNEPTSPHHHPEFLMLEWYRAHETLDALTRDLENLFSRISKKIFQKEELSFGMQKIDLTPPWPRKTVESLFEEKSLPLIENDEWVPTQKLIGYCKQNKIQVTGDESWDDLYFRLWLNLIEPHLPKDRPFFVWDYPPTQSALAQIKTDERGVRTTDRFELYCGGIELANAFQELTDSIEQEKRFKKEIEYRKENYKSQTPPAPIDESFIAALKEGLPESAGIALGMDRVVQLFANEKDLLFTLWLPSYLP